MFNVFKKKSPTAGQTVEFKINGMHCASCAMSIDGELEDTAGVQSATTSFAKAKTVVTFDPTVVDVEKLEEVISSLDYQPMKVE